MLKKFHNKEQSSYDNMIPHYTLNNQSLKRKINYSMININGTSVHNQILKSKVNSNSFEVPTK